MPISQSWRACGAMMYGIRASRECRQPERACVLPGELACDCYLRCWRCKACGALRELDESGWPQGPEYRSEPICNRCAESLRVAEWGKVARDAAAYCAAVARLTSAVSPFPDGC